jgi:hypothetical protein
MVTFGDEIYKGIVGFPIEVYGIRNVISMGEFYGTAALSVELINEVLFGFRVRSVCEYE